MSLCLQEWKQILGEMGEENVSEGEDEAEDGAGSDDSA